jgi:hypothetical protein
MQMFLRRPNRLKKLAGKMLPPDFKHQLVKKLLNINKKPFNYPAMEPATKQWLRRQFTEDIVELQELTGRDLTHWLQNT